MKSKNRVLFLPAAANDPGPGQRCIRSGAAAGRQPPVAIRKRDSDPACCRSLTAISPAGNGYYPAQPSGLPQPDGPDDEFSRFEAGVLIKNVYHSFLESPKA